MAQYTLQLAGKATLANVNQWKSDLDTMLLSAPDVEISLRYVSPDNATIPNNATFNFFRDRVSANARVIIEVNDRS